MILGPPVVCTALPSLRIFFHSDGEAPAGDKVVVQSHQKLSIVHISVFKQSHLIFLPELPSTPMHVWVAAQEMKSVNVSFSLLAVSLG